MKIIIFGLGNIFSQYASQIDFADVVAIADNDFYKTRTYLYGKYVISPDLLLDYEFDYVAIFNNRYAKDIFNQLKSSGIEECKIVSWQYYLFFLKRNVNCFSNACLFYVHNALIEANVKAVLDVDAGLAKNGFFAAFCDFSDCSVDNYALKDSLLKAFYEETVSKIECRYDALVCLDYFISHSLEEFLVFLNENAKKFRRLIFSVPYAYPAKFTEWAEYDFSFLGETLVYNCHTAKLIVIDTKKSDEDPMAPKLKKNAIASKIVAGDLKLLAVTHKKFTLPKNDPMFFPIYAGKGDDNDMNIPGDATKDNISYLNPLINECTALYWFWKNTRYEYVGLCHYRRYFGDGDKVIEGDKIFDLLKKHDMIVTKAVYFYPLSVKEQLKITLQKDSFEVGYNLVRNIVVQKCPEYLNDFDEYFDGHFIYPCNMFVTNRQIFDRYCSWLFDIIIPAATQIDVSGYDSYSKRVVGFMAERLLTLWILHNGIKVKEVPIINFEN